MVCVAHKSDALERDVRCAISKSIKQKCALVVACENLAPDEYNTLYRLTDCYDHIVVCTAEELAENIEKASSISASQ